MNSSTATIVGSIVVVIVVLAGAYVGREVYKQFKGA
jgi:hypothetical protein